MSSPTMTLEVECIDLSLSLYIPKLVYPAGVVGLFKGHRDMPLASGALMDQISRDLVASVHRLIRDEGVDLVQLARGQRRDDVALGYLAEHDGTEGITLVGRARRGAPSFAPSGGSAPAPAPATRSSCEPPRWSTRP